MKNTIKHKCAACGHDIIVTIDELGNINGNVTQIPLEPLPDDGQTKDTIDIACPKCVDEFQKVFGTP